MLKSFETISLEMIRLVKESIVKSKSRKNLDEIDMLMVIYVSEIHEKRSSF